MTQLKQASVGLAALICLLAVSLFAVVAPGSAAKPKKKPTELTLGYTGSNFRGLVKSVNACEPSRKVILFEVDSQGFVSRVDTTSSANAGGKYAFGPMMVDITSEYYTKAPRTKVSGVICKTGRSERFSFEM